MTDSDLHSHLARLGSSGGLANTPKQRLTQRLNAYRTLAKRYPANEAIRLELARLEGGESGPVDKIDQSTTADSIKILRELKSR